MRRFTSLALAVILGGALAACHKPGADAGVPTAASRAASAPTLLLAPEDIRTVKLASRAQGAVITGSIEPERRADLRAELAAVVLQVLRENGEPVKRGDLLVRLDDTSIRDGYTSAQEAERASAQALDQSQRTYDRLKTLQAQGMSSMQATEDAAVRRNSAQSDLAAAKSRLVAARQQLSRAEVRAPFDGIVGERKVSAGDTVQVGRELIKVLDPSSMRLEGWVSADRLSELKVGQEVRFQVNGFPQTEFVGKVRRVSATADPTTRQVEVIVDFTDGNAPRMAGLYAEGRIASGAGQVLVLSESSIVKRGDTAHVWRVEERSLRKVPVKLGERDARRGDFVILGGLADGDLVLREPSASLVDGQRVEFAAPAASSAASAAMATGSGTRGG